MNTALLGFLIIVGVLCVVYGFGLILNRLNTSRGNTWDFFDIMHEYDGWGNYIGAGIMTIAVVFVCSFVVGWIAKAIF